MERIYYLRTMNNEYIYKVRKNNYYVSDCKYRCFCGLNYMKFRNYRKRLDAMGVPYEVEKGYKDLIN